jgi:hypothetical protein
MSPWFRRLECLVLYCEGLCLHSGRKGRWLLLDVGGEEFGIRCKRLGFDAWMVLLIDDLEDEKCMLIGYVFVRWLLEWE